MSVRKPKELYMLGETACSCTVSGVAYGLEGDIFNAVKKNLFPVELK